MPLARGRYRQDEGTDQSTAAADPTAATSAAGGDNHFAADLMPTGKYLCTVRVKSLLQTVIDMLTIEYFSSKVKSHFLDLALQLSDVKVLLE